MAEYSKETIRRRINELQNEGIYIEKENQLLLIKKV